MAFGDRLKKRSGGFKDTFRVIDPLGAGAIFGSRSKLPTPSPQNYGGTPEAADAYRDQYNRGIDVGRGDVRRGLTSANAAASQAAGALDQSRTAAMDDASYARGERGQADAGFGRAMRDFRSGRGSILGNAATLEQDAANLQRDYQQTADRQFALNQDRNQRAALSVAAGRGPNAVRTALAGSTQANADAAAQAEITRASETNQLAQMKQNALTQAAGIRSGVGAQDQGAAGLYSTRQLQANQDAMGANSQAATIAGNKANIQQNAAALGVNAGTTQQGQYLGALTGMETAQLAADQKNEEAKINAAMAQRNSRGLLGKIWG